MRQVPGGWIYTVQGVTLHCPRCPKDVVLTDGDEVFVENEDSSSVYCLKHIPPPRKKVEREEGQPSVPRRKHRRERAYEQMVL
jgi:hypothetical protein